MLSFVSLAPLCFDILLPYWKEERLNILLSQKESKQKEDLIIYNCILNLVKYGKCIICYIAFLFSPQKILMDTNHTLIL